MNRRSFLRTAATGSLALGAGPDLFAALAADNPYRRNIGLQLYTLRDALARDAAGTLKAVAKAGYKQVELFGFPDCQPLIDGAKEAGLAIHSAHFNWDSAVNPKDEGMSDFARIVERAEKLGLSDLVVPYLHDGDRRTLDDYKRVAGNLNKAGAMTKEAGIRLSYHNHAFEFEPKDGGTPGFAVFIGEFSSDVYFELDVFWVKVGGLDPVELIGQLSDRVSQLHLKDLKKGIETPAFGGLPEDAFKELGAGSIAFEPILEAAEKAGVRHCHVEQDHSPDPLKSIRESLAYLGKL